MSSTSMVETETVTFNGIAFVRAGWNTDNMDPYAFDFTKSYALSGAHELFKCTRCGEVMDRIEANKHDCSALTMKERHKKLEDQELEKMREELKVFGGLYGCELEHRTETDADGNEYSEARCKTHGAVMQEDKPYCLRVAFSHRMRQGNRSPYRSVTVTLAFVTENNDYPYGQPTFVPRWIHGTIREEGKDEENINVSPEYPGKKDRCIGTYVDSCYFNKAVVSDEVKDWLRKGARLFFPRWYSVTPWAWGQYVRQLEAVWREIKDLGCHHDQWEEIFVYTLTSVVDAYFKLEGQGMDAGETMRDALADLNEELWREVEHLVPKKDDARNYRKRRAEGKGMLI